MLHIKCKILQEGAYIVKILSNELRKLHKAGGFVEHLIADSLQAVSDQGSLIAYRVCQKWKRLPNNHRIKNRLAQLIRMGHKSTRYK